MGDLKGPFFHEPVFSAGAPLAQARHVVQVAHGSLLHDVQRAFAVLQHAMSVHHMGMAVIDPLQLQTVECDTVHAAEGISYPFRGGTEAFGDFGLDNRQLAAVRSCF